MRRFPLLLSVLVVVGAAALAAVWLTTRDDHHSTAQAAATPAASSKSYAYLAAHNYKVLSPARTKELMDFADRFYACMSKQGSAIGKPQPSNTKIVFALPAGTRFQQVATPMASCGRTLGDPPPDASLVFTPQRHIELYLPKQCLLDRKTVSGHTGAAGPS